MTDKEYRTYLNKQYPGTGHDKGRGTCTGNTHRKYGDYLFVTDREIFDAGKAEYEQSIGVFCPRVDTQIQGL